MQKRWHHTLQTTTATALIMVASAASAQAPQIPTSVDPAQVQDRFDAEPQPQPVDSAPERPRAGVPLHAPKQNEATFTLKTIEIIGATVYSEADFKPMFTPLLGSKITLTQLQGIADQITAHYRADGYILSQAVIPQQEVEGGHVKIRVVEGYVANVVISGEVKENGWRSLMQSYGEKVRQEKPLRMQTLERYLLLMDDLPGAEARGTLRPSADTFGAAELVVSIAHQTFEGSVSTDNRGTRYIGPHQHSLTLAGNSLLGLYDRTVLRGITTSPVSELQYFDVQHEQQVGAEGTRIILSASKTRTEPAYTLTPLDIEGDADNYQLRVQHPFIRTRAENLLARAAFDYRNSDTDALGTPYSKDHLRSLRVGATYDFSDDWRGVNLIDAQLSKGLNIFGASESGPIRSRFDGESDYMKFNADLARTQSLPWGLSLLAGVSGQYSWSRLLAGEQFAIGGASFGRAYDPAELSGDHGVAGKLELRYGDVPNWSFLNAYQLYTFYDIGKVWDKVNTGDNTSLASAGIGVRANFTEHYSGSVEFAVPLTKEVAVENDNDPRIFFNLTGRF